jgi:hypothetical protein
VRALLLSCPSVAWVSHGHAETGFESNDFAAGEILDGLATSCSTFSKWVAQSVHTFKCSISYSKVYYSYPVVGEVFGRYAARA